jgi:hypothetical protein
MNKTDIHRALSSFMPVGLNEMDDVSLMNRVETKYVFSSGRLPDLLDLLSISYKVLEIETLRSFQYQTIYLDTPDLKFYTQQLRGKLNRHKIRYRQYKASGVSFLEIKKKTNKNRTMKWRIKNTLNNNSPDETASAFIREFIQDDFPVLRPVLMNGFTRITLIGKELKERITLDHDLTFENSEGSNTALPYLAVAELKRERHSGQSPVGIIMKHAGIHPGSFSKYCIGNTLTMEMPRINVLKPNLLLINKIENEYLQSS